MDMMASPRTKDGAAMLTSMGINPLRKAARPPSAEQEAATREQAALRKRVRDAEHAQLEADSDLAASDPTPAEAASAWRQVKFAANARAQRKLETNNSIAKQRAEDAEAAALQAPEPLTKKTKPAGDWRRAPYQAKGNRGRTQEEEEEEEDSHLLNRGDGGRRWARDPLGRP